MTARISMHAVSGVSFKQQYWPATNDRHAFHTTDITIIDKDGERIDVELFSSEQLSIESPAAPEVATLKVAA